VRLTLLGPQRRPTVDQVVRTIDGGAPLATVTAGWEEREPDDSEMDALLGGRSINLGLYGRWLDVQERDPEYATAELDHRAFLDEMRQLHLVQLESAARAMYALARRSGDRPRAITAALADAEAVVRIVDDSHLARVRAAHEDFRAAYPPEDRPVIAEHRAAVSQILEHAAGLVVAGGHVGVLVRALALFNVAARVPPAVVAWSAGAMALTDRVVLFHDNAPHGPTPAEIYDDGLGLIRDVVLLPHARRRLRVDDLTRMSVLARRFAPAKCVVLDDGTRMDLTPEGGLPPGARVVAADGRITTLEDE
jgi:hypothetical protein